MQCGPGSAQRVIALSTAKSSVLFKMFSVHKHSRDTLVVRKRLLVCCHLLVLDSGHVTIMKCVERNWIVGP